ncbi:peptidase S41-like protein [Winogradskyella wandonensis]|uniref:Peptidase S41-like protein n=1 Tax=Winogradskyella wandonensis TaxID=1442586 RepID=A0A4R1KZ22_9FLAO|nr:S41 family peptidase [Winogradskyella wandonensis]TCK69339.1 peptidase S41-like protein [Winogradskyella wandonensis]
MKKITLFLFVFISGFQVLTAQIQTCDCKTDLDFIVEKIKKMPSYKKQIKGKEAIKFENIYESLLQKMIEPINVEECYRLLLKQMNMVNDVHASLQINNQDNNIVFSPKKLYGNNSNKVQSLKSITKELEKKDISDKEGIYNYGEEKIGIVYNEKSKQHIGFVIETNLENWIEGEIRFYLYPIGSNKYNMYYYKTKKKTPGFVRSLSFENGRIWSYKKVGNTDNFELLSEKIEVADFKQISDDTQYLYFKTFSNSKKKELLKFYNEIKDKLTAPNIIVDLRSNSGGNSKYSDSYIKLLRNKNVYVITNCFTGSNGEQFTLKLLKNKNAKHLGQTTRGIIAYGKNYGYNYTTPSGYFNITPTDMNFHKYIDYESKGITPSIALDFKKDWVEQTLEIVEKDSN